jgi:hypothetical protein
VVQIDELAEALNRITNDGSRVNRSLAMIRREQFGGKSHHQDESKLRRLYSNYLILLVARLLLNTSPQTALTLDAINLLTICYPHSYPQAYIVATNRLASLA